MYKVTDTVKIFPQQGGWYYVSVPKTHTEELKSLAQRGLVAIKVSLNDYSWDTSLLPMGDGTQFIALNAKVRKRFDLKLGDRVSVTYVPRNI
jgi:hypothetical protein